MKLGLLIVLLPHGLRDFWITLYLLLLRTERCGQVVSIHASYSGRPEFTSGLVDLVF
jgi:hypothetical protein